MTDYQVQIRKETAKSKYM